MRISVVIPCYRSSATLPELVAELHAALGAESGSPASDYEVVLVVDGSPDDTADVARNLADHAKVRCVELRRNYGQHNALLAGVLRAQFEVVVTMDDDLQHRPDEISALVEPLHDESVDLVYGVAQEEEHGFWRSLASRVVKRGLSASGVPSATDVSAFRAFRRSLNGVFADVNDPYVSMDVLLSWATTGVRRVTVQMDERTVGTSNYSLRSLIRHTLNMVTGYSTLPLRAVAWLGAFCASLGIGLLVFVLVKFIAGDITVAGWTTLASMIAIFSGAQMISIAVLGEYVGRLHTRSMQRPTYVVRRDSALADDDTV
ncbi:glycosyltransferase family 2 protein [Sanguibacter sp. A247]|uniref:glycosyltransferase family 2 protein n=1 Tax=unclassified Sanguibacter TaxID=2645534 RepID=UPI003FD740E2